MSQNTRGLGNQLKRRKIFRSMKHNKADIVFLQEVHSTSKTNSLWSSEWGQMILFANGEGNAKGVVTMLSKELSKTVKEIRRDINGRYVICKLEIRNYTYCLVNLYAPNRDDSAFFQEIFSHIDELECVYIIMGGDFNVAREEKIDRSKCEQYHPKAANFIHNQMENWQLADVWRQGHPNKKTFTWNKFHHGKKTLSWSRIDYFLITSGLVHKTLECEIMPSFASDHSQIKLDLQIDDTKRGPGYWKMNNKLLNDPEYCEMMINSMQSMKKTFGYLDPKIFWEMQKFEVGNATKEIVDTTEQEELHGNMEKVRQKYRQLRKSKPKVR